MKALLLVIFSTTCLRAQTSSNLVNPIDRLAVAIAKAEGFYRQGTIPNRSRNPGDIKVIRGKKYFGQVGVGKGGHVIFRNDAAGWYALREQVRKMVEGESRFYTPQMSLYQVARRYAGDYRIWARNVGRNLGVSPTCTLAELFDIPPTLREVGL